VYVWKGIFTKTGGTIYGYSASDTVKSNVVKNSSGTVGSNNGHAVFAYGYDDNRNDTVEKRKETTAGTGANMAFNGTVRSPTFSGSWDY